jgi:NADH-quinone oxidoreductase subunit E
MDTDRIDQIIDKHHGEANSLIQILLEIQSENHNCEPSYLIQVLLDIQEENNWLPREALERVAERLQVPLTRIQHIATFYKAFSLVPKGRHEVHVCMGTACHVRGASRVLQKVQELTGVKPGETDLDMKFSLETVNCLGCCALGPVVEIDGKTHGKLSQAGTAELLKRYDD